MTPSEHDTYHPHLPPQLVDPAAVNARYLAVLAADGPAEFRRALVASVCDIPRLVSEVDRLWLLLVRTRRQHANLLAAVRATLAAAREGEADPLSYLRDELPDHSQHGRGGR